MKILEWWAEKGRIRVRFPYDPMLLAEVKLITGRQWHREEKFWSIPMTSAGEAGTRLIPLGFDAAPEVEKLLNGEIDGIAGLVRESETVREGSAPSRESESSGDWSVSRLNEEVRAAILQGLPNTLWLQGEIMGADRSLGRGSSASHLYFRLVEKEEGADRPLAEISAVMWNFRQDSSFQKLQENGTPLEDGLKIRVKVRLDLYVARGQFQVVVEKIDPEFTLGELARRREEILAEIRRLGIDRQNLDRAMPRVPLRVGVITSPGSDAWKDFHDELKISGFAFEVSLFGARVQGEGAERDLLRALQYFSDHAEDFDSLVLIRGGGSKTDLMAFDTLELARAVAMHPVKVICGIGHHADRSVLDELAHSEKTPTAVGQYLVSRVQESWDSVTESASAICDRVQSMISAEEDRLQMGRQRLLMRADRSLAVANEKYSSQLEGSTRRWRRAIQQEKEALRSRGKWVQSATSARTQLEKTRQENLARRLLSAANHQLIAQKTALKDQRLRILLLSDRGLDREREKLEIRTRRNRSADPQQILGRGFAWIKNEHGKTVRGTGEVESGDKVQIRLSDGSLEARVE